MVLRVTRPPDIKTNKLRRAGARGKFAMEIVIDRYSSWRGHHEVATEVRLLMQRCDAEEYITEGVDSLVRYKQEIKILEGLEEDWPVSLSDDVLEDAREHTLTVLNVRGRRKSAIADPNPAIHTGACCEKGLFSYTRAYRHLLCVEKTAMNEMKALQNETPVSAEKEKHSLEIAKYEHFLSWLKYIFGCLDRARKTVLVKLEDYHKGALPQRLDCLRPEYDAPKEIVGLCASCAESVTISPNDGDVYLKGDENPHEICESFGNKLFERLDAARVVSMSKEILGLSSDADTARLGNFLRSGTKNGSIYGECLNRVLRSIEITTDSTEAITSTTPTPLFIEIRCPVCTESALLSPEGNVCDTTENNHRACNAPNLFERLELALIPNAQKNPKCPRSAEKSVPSSVGLSEHDRTLVLNAIIQHPGKRFKTIAQCVLAGDESMDKNLNREHVAQVVDDLKSRKDLDDVEKLALKIRSTRANKSTNQVPVTTPQPRRRRKTNGGGGGGSGAPGVKG